MHFHTRSNTWDLCTMLGDPADDDKQCLDELNSDEEAIAEYQDRWFLEPNVPALPPVELRKFDPPLWHAPYGRIV